MLMKKIIILIVLYCSICISSYGQCPTSIEEFNLSDLDFIFAGTPNCADVPQPATVFIEGIAYSFCCCFSNELGGTSAISQYSKSVPAPHPLAPYTIDFNGQSCTYASGGVLPTTFSSITATDTEVAIKITWETETEINGDIFEVQRALNSPEKFISLATVSASGNNRSSAPYSYMDEDMLMGALYYRIKAVDLNGIETYSSVAVIQKNETLDFKLQSNLVRDELSWNIPSETIHTLTVYDTQGNIIHQDRPQSQSLEIETLSNGLYFLKASGTFGESKTIKFIKN